MQINWEALGVITAILATLAFPIFNKIKSGFENYLKEIILEEFDKIFLEKKRLIREDVSNAFEEYYYPLDSQIKYLKEKLLQTQQHYQQLSRINEVRIEKLEKKPHDSTAIQNTSS